MMKKIEDPANKKQEAEGLELTEQMQLFVQEYMLDYNASRAAVAAGYSEKAKYSTAHKLLKHPAVSVAIDERREVLMLELGIQQEYVVNKLVDIINRNKGKNDGNVLKALDMLSKIGGFYTQTVTNINVEVPLFPDLNTEDQDGTVL